MSLFEPVLVGVSAGLPRWVGVLTKTKATGRSLWAEPTGRGAGALRAEPTGRGAGTLPTEAAEGGAAASGVESRSRVEGILCAELAGPGAEFSGRGEGLLGAESLVAGE